MPRTYRRLLLLRHAKSAWPDGVPDHERPLEERGRRDGAAAGRWLSEAGLRPDLAVVSSARRAVETWELVAHGTGGAGDVLVTDQAYAASTGDLLELLRGAPADAACVLLVGHNPGMERLADLLDDGQGPEDDRVRMHMKFPTSGLAVLDVPGEWSALDPQTARLSAFVVPRG
ncbi:MAG TPA: histidine phosphatase family protein [Jiangellales bacterium]|nr:histidine phosphatase family protein [Jiangellales bacterium]